MPRRYAILRVSRDCASRKLGRCQRILNRDRTAQWESEGYGDDDDYNDNDGDDDNEYDEDYNDDDNDDDDDDDEDDEDEDYGDDIFG